MQRRHQLPISTCESPYVEVSHKFLLVKMLDLRQGQRKQPKGERGCKTTRIYQRSSSLSSYFEGGNPAVSTMSDLGVTAMFPGTIFSHAHSYTVVGV